MTRALRSLAALTLLLALPGVAEAQYFGRNKVKYGSFDFKIVQTQHFDVHYYDREEVAGLDVARMAERSYAQLSRILSHEFEERKPIILYASHADFQQTNTDPGEVDEGTGGFTDYLLHRNIFPLTGAYEDIEHVLQHEMVHQFQFDIWSRGRGIQGIIQVNAPLWWGEGMAEYLSLGPVNPNTAMWLRDAALEGKLPTPQQFYQFFPYRYGHALVSYIGSRWGDEAIGQITKGATAGGIEGALRRVTGLPFEQLVLQWHEAVQKQYLPEVGDRVKARTMSTPLLTEKISEGGWHLAPALSPDGSLVAYFSEKDFYFVDMYLADGNTGKVIRRLLKSTFSSNYETYRYINSSAAWSADGRHLVFAAKRGARDDIVIVDPKRNKEVRRIRVREVDGITNPAFSPDGTRIVFSGLVGGLSDLFIVGADGKNLRRLTEDKHADLNPVWSPDGRTLAFVTDRGPATDFTRLVWGNFRVGLMDIESGRIDLPEAMGVGKNSSPQWSPDGQSLAFVSDRNAVNNLFLFELADRQAYQITDFYTGIQGITPLSPTLSWSQGSDRIAFVYFEQGKYDVYTLSSPRLLKRDPWRPGQAGPVIAGRTGTAPGAPGAIAGAGPGRPAGAATQQPRPPFVLSTVSLYRAPEGFRRADSLAGGADSVAGGPEPVSIARILDSTSYDLPDTAEFLHRGYKVKFNPEYISQPTIGYARDNFGRGLYGQATVILGDMLGDQRLAFSATLNGRLEELSGIAQYVNQSQRYAWVIGFQQQPSYGYGTAGSIPSETPGEAIYIEQYRRYIYRTLFGGINYPTSRFQRFELGLEATMVDEDILEYFQPYELATGFPTDVLNSRTVDVATYNYAMPTLAWVFDNALYGYVGPFLGRRSRIEVGQSIGSWQFFQGTADFRRYDKVAGPVILATRVFYFGRRGRDAELFQFYGGTTELVRGHTYGSYEKNECLTGGALNACAVNNLIGSQAAVGNVELRFPLWNTVLAGLPLPFGGLETAVFFDAGLVWDNESNIKWNRDENDPFIDPAQFDPALGGPEVRNVVRSWGLSLRGNLLGFLPLRLDYARPLSRPLVKHYWTLSLGPTF
jgi:hypothetical protein